MLLSEVIEIPDSFVTALSLRWPVHARQDTVLELGEDINVGLKDTSLGPRPCGAKSVRLPRESRIVKRNSVEMNRENQAVEIGKGNPGA